MLTVKTGEWWAIKTGPDEEFGWEDDNVEVGLVVGKSDTTGIVLYDVYFPTGDGVRQHQRLEFVTFLSEVQNDSWDDAAQLYERIVNRA